MNPTTPTKFVSIERAKNILTGSEFIISTHVDQSSANESVVTTPNSDGLFSTELVVGDLVEFYDWEYKRTASVTVKSVDSATQFTATNLVNQRKTAHDNRLGTQITLNSDEATRDRRYHYATFVKQKIGNVTIVGDKRDKQIKNEHNIIRLNLDMIKYYYPDPRYTDNMLVDIGTDTAGDFSTSDIKRDDIRLVSPPSDITFSGTVGTNKNDLTVKKYAVGLVKDTDYRVQIDGAGTAAIFTVDCVADVNGSLHGTGFKLYSVENDNSGGSLTHVLIYVVKDAFSYSPLRGLPYFYRANKVFVEIDKGATAAQVAQATKDRLEEFLGTGGSALLYTITISTAQLTFTSVDKGVVSVPKDLGYLSNNTIAVESSLDTKDSIVNASRHGSYGLDSAGIKPEPILEEVRKGRNKDAEDIGGISKITCTSGSFVSAGFEDGDGVFLNGLSEKNNRMPQGYLVHTVSANTMLLKRDSFLTENTTDSGNAVTVTSGPCGFTFGTSTPGVTETFEWSDSDGAIWNDTGVTLKGDHLLNNELVINFNTTFGHTNGNYWTFTCSASTKIAAKEDIKKLDKLLC